MNQQKLRNSCKLVLFKKLAAWMTEAMPTAITYICAQCQGQPAGSFLLLLVGPHTDRMQLDRGVVPAQVQKRPILKKTVELQQQFLDAHDLLEGSISAQVLATRQPQDTHREVCVLTRSVRIYFVRVHCDDVVPIWQSTSPYFRQNYTSKTHMKEPPVTLEHNFPTPYLFDIARNHQIW